MSLRRVRDFIPLVEQSALGPDSIAVIHDEVRRLARAIQTEPLGDILPDLTALQDLTFRLIERPAASSPRSKDLYFLAAAASAMVAAPCLQLGDRNAAMTHLRAGWVCADSAGHNPMKAFVLGGQALTAYWADATTDAIRYCELANAVSPGSGAVSAFLPAIEARAHAARGDAAALADAARRAEVARESVQTDDLDAIGGDLTFPRLSQLYYTADAYSWLPDQADSAMSTALAAVQAYAAASGTDGYYEASRIRSHAALALARVRTGDLDGAEAALRPVLDIAPGYQTDTVNQHARRVHTALTTPTYAGSTAARALLTEIEHFLRTPPHAIPS